MHQLRQWLGDLWQWSRRQKIFFVILTLVGTFVFLYAARVHAEGVDFLKDPVTYIGGIIGSIIAWIIEFLTKLIIIVVDILIQLASHNNFVHAKPVEVGWVLMRDVANMFFIVLLLVSAFSTIIRYQPFHYKSVLPKLLLMAVVINFSKTLVGLLIDFSQVIMLTFVNAFRQAAAGNIVSALHLDKITQIDSGNNPAEGEMDKYSMANLIIAGLLGIFMLSIALTVVCIMLIFIVARIVGLWLALIIAPIAFFATALPDKAAKALDAFTGAYWSRLSGMLVGGPVMAFFLWLTLAVVQGDPQEFKSMYTARGEAQAATSGDASSAANFSTVVGNAGDIASFIIAIAMLMMGVEFAVKSAAAVSGTAGKLAGSLAAGGGVAAHLLRGATRVTKKTAQVTGKVAGKAGGAAFEGVDRLTDVRGKIGRTGMKLSASMGGVGEKTFSGMAGYRGQRRKEAAAAMNKNMENMTMEDKMDYLQRRQGSMLSSQYAQSASTSALAGMATTGAGMKALTNKAIGGLDKNKYKTPAEQKAAAEAIALTQASNLVKSGIENAKANGDEAQESKFKDVLKNDSRFQTDPNELSALKHADVGDKPGDYMQKIKPDDIKDSRVAMAHAHALGLIDANGNEVKTDGKDKLWEQFNRGNRGKIMEDHMKNLTPEQRKAQLDAMDSSEAKVLAASEASRRYATLNKNAQGKFEVGSVGVAGAVASTQPQVAPKASRSGVVRNEAAISAGREKLKEMGARGNVKANDAEAVAVKAEMAAAGATLKEAYKVDDQGLFANKENKLAFGSSMSQWGRDIQAGDNKALDKFANLDLETLAKNEGGYNEARSEAIGNFPPEVLEKAMDMATKDNNIQAQNQIRKFVEILGQEASRVSELAKNAGISDDEWKAANSGYGASGAAARQRLVMAGIGDEKIAGQAARAVTSYQRAHKSRTLRPMTPTTRTDVKNAVKGASGKVKEVVMTPNKMSRLAQAAEPGIRAVGRAAASGARAVGGAAKTVARGGNVERAAAAFESSAKERVRRAASGEVSGGDVEKMERKLMEEAERKEELLRNKPPAPPKPSDDEGV